jgi:hypothetical protein
MAGIRSKDTFLRALYERQRARIGHRRALGAIKHSMVAAWHTLTNKEPYHDAGGTYFTQRNPQPRPDGSSPNPNAWARLSPSDRRRQPGQAPLPFSPT